MIFVLALLFGVILLLLGTALMGMSGSESSNAHRDVWSEGAFWAAEAGVQTGYDQLSMDSAISTQAFSGSIVNNTYSFRSGPRSASGPMELEFVRKINQPFYSLASGEAYNRPGYDFYEYLITATGTHPRSSMQREIEARAAFGPVAM